jgi:hypothetical protein
LAVKAAHQVQSNSSEPPMKLVRPGLPFAARSER